MYERISALIPPGFMHAFKKQLAYNGIEVKERRLAGFLLVYGISLSLAIAFGAEVFFGILFPIAFASTLAIFYFSIYAMLKMNSEAKGRFVERILPDALQLIASNMKSGLTTERALFVAGRPEFGLLQTELKNASKRISSGEQVERALLGISERINSTALNKTLWLICEGIKSGGQISDLLYQLADDQKNQQALEDEAKANISIYIILILFASMVGAPLLFGVSSFVVQVITKQISKTPKINLDNTSNTGNLDLVKSFVSGDRSLVSTDFVVIFLVITLICGSFFACLTIGIMNTGKEINGLKYALPIMAVAILLFFATRTLLISALGNLA